MDDLETNSIVPYFERVWIIQEVLLSTSKVLLWGNTSIDWRDFYLASHCMANNDNLFSMEGPSRTEGMKRVYSLSHNPGELYFLLHVTSRKATDEHDKVYAILGLVELASTFLSADYTKSIQEVFMDAAKSRYTRGHVITCSIYLISWQTIAR
jgi:hypothetical protein